MAKAALSRAVKLFGTDVPNAKRRILTAGPISAMLDNGALRYISYHGTEVLRGIAYLVRDKNWGTYAPEISDLKVRQAKDAFTVSYSAKCKDPQQGISYKASIVAKADGTLKFLATGTPQTDFLTNRTGFVVLHPLNDVVGKPVEIIHTDGKREKSKFPKFISPGQPVFEIRSLKHTVVPGVTATVLMEGNKFEMEDHRNWMDASYKTYVCSLLDPWPYTLDKGKEFTQSVTLSITGKPAKKLVASKGKTITVAIGKPQGRLPAIGIGVPMAEAEATLAKAELVAAAKPANLVFQIDGRHSGKIEAARAFARLKEMTGASVTLEIVLPAKAPAHEEVASIASAVNDGGLKPDAVVVTQVHDLKSFQPGTPRPWGPTYEEMAAACRTAFPGVTLGGGMLSYFTELNRKRPPKDVFDFITHTVCPIVHAADDISVMETLESIPSIAASTRAMIGKVPYHIGPSSIPCRDNPYGATVAANPGNGRVCLADMDPRQRGLFAAAWNIGLVAATARAKLERVALGATTGPQGIIHARAEYAQPWYDQNKAQVFPAYHVLASLAPRSGMTLLATASSAPAKIEALTSKEGKGSVTWLANLTSEKQSVKLTGVKGKASVQMLDEDSFASLAQKPERIGGSAKQQSAATAITLKPYAVAIVTVG